MTPPKFSETPGGRKLIDDHSAGLKIRGIEFLVDEAFAAGMDQERKEIEKEFTGYTMLKPVDMDALIETIRRQARLAELDWIEKEGWRDYAEGRDFKVLIIPIKKLAARRKEIERGEE